MSTTDELRDFVEKNDDMLGRVLACGNEEARGYALALLLNSGDLDGVEDVQDELDRIKLKVR